MKGGNYMFCQLFGNYLVENNVFSEKENEEIIEKLRNTRVKLGFLAVSEGYLTETEANEINRLQATEDRKFGEIAVDNGFLSQQQLDELLSRQKGEYVKFIQILCEEKGFALSEVNGYIEDFRRSQGFDADELEALKQEEFDKIVPMYAFASKAHITDLASLMLRNIMRFVSTDFYLERIKKVSSVEYSSLVGVELTGEASVHLGFLAQSNQEGLKLLADRYAGDEFSSVGEEMYDAIGEFSNCIAGLFATDLSRKGINTEITPQFAYENQTAEGEAYILPIIIERKEVFFYVSVSPDVVVGDNPIERRIKAAAGSVEGENSKGSVVIVDDSCLSRKVLRSVLEENNYTVVAEATDGIEGIEAYKDYHPDLITLDITMPNLAGDEALLEIMNYDSNANVIMITAAGQESKIIAALKAGAKRFITKPFSVDDIIKNVKEVLEE